MFLVNVRVRKSWSVVGTFQSLPSVPRVIRSFLSLRVVYSDTRGVRVRELFTM